MRYWILLTAIFGISAAVDANAQDTLVKATNLEKLNTAADEEDPFLSADGKELLYSSKAKKSYDIYVSKRTTLTAAFGAGKPFIFDRAADVRCPFKYQDRYYFATNEVPDEKFAKLKNFDIMVQIGTQRPFPVLGEINTKADEMYPWVTPAGKEFYFSRKVEGDWKLFVANGPVPGPIGKAKEVAFPANFHRATVAGKGLTM